MEYRATALCIRKNGLMQAMFLSDSRLIAGDDLLPTDDCTTTTSTTLLTPKFYPRDRCSICQDSDK